MKIGFFTDSYLPDPNGITTAVCATADALSARGHTVYIIAPNYPGYKDKRNVVRLASVKIYDHLDMRMALHLPDRTLLKVLRMNFDVIHGHAGGPVTLIGWEAAKLKNIPFVATYHTMLTRYTHYFFKGKILKPKMMEWVSRIFGNMCDCIIAPTTRVKEELISYGVKKPIMVLPSGIDCKRYQGKTNHFLKKRLGISPQTKIILCVARFGREKSLDFLLKSFAKIHASLPDTALVLVGDGPEREKLERIRSEAGLTSCVYFTGFIPQKDMPSVYKDADLFVFASQTETQGLVIFEALAAGLPVVAVDNTTFHGMITSGENGFLVKRSRFAANVIDVLKDEQERSRLSQNATSSSSAFSVEQTAEALEQLYKKLIEKQKRTRATGLRGRIKAIREYLDLT